MKRVSRMRRREFLTISATALGGVLVCSLDGQAVLLGAPGKEKKQAVRIALRFFTAEEAAIAAAAAARIFPRDQSGPGAKEAGVAIYIDRQLAGPYGRDLHRYTAGPFEEGAAAEFGYQGKATPREIYRQGLKGLAGLHHLSAGEQDEALRKIESSDFFALLRQHTIEGMFCDPLHGGNADMVGWQLIGFPGPRMNNADDLDKHYGEAFRPVPVKLRDAAGHPVRGSEDQK